MLNCENATECRAVHFQARAVPAVWNYKQFISKSVKALVVSPSRLCPLDSLNFPECALVRVNRVAQSTFWTSNPSFRRGAPRATMPLAASGLSCSVAHPCNSNDPHERQRPRHVCQMSSSNLISYHYNRNLNAQAKRGRSCSPMR